MDLAPIILFVYNRPWHTQQTLRALRRNSLASQSLLYIFSDGAKNDARLEEQEKIKEVRRIIRKENWCQEVKIIERDENLGLANSVILGVSDIISKHGKVIVLEDDIVTGKFFLNFMNEALIKYEFEEKVFGVSGYKYPSARKIKQATYFLPIASSWSFATWKERWDKVNFDGRELLREIEDGDFQQELDFGGNTFYNMLKDQIEGRNDSWAIRFYTSMFLEKAYFLYPNISLVQNIGFDDSGVHCSQDDFYTLENLSHKRIEFQSKRVEVQEEIFSSFEDSFLSREKNTKPPISIKNKLAKLLRIRNS